MGHSMGFATSTTGFLHQLLTPGVSMTQRVLRAGFWSFFLRSFFRGLGFIRNVVLARILAPDDFGLFGIALVVLSILERFSSTGLQTALVQKKAQVDEYLDTAWTILAFRSVCIAVTIVVIAPYAAEFLEEPRATPFIQVLAVSVFLHGLQNTGLVHYQRELEVYRQTLHRVGGNVIELIVSVIAAIILKNAWALMIGLIAGRIASLVISYAVHPYRPRIRFRSDQARELSRFGRWIFLDNILYFLAHRGDNLIIGKVLGAPALGVYLLAYSISEVVAFEISRIITGVVFPAFSRVQGELKRLQKAYLGALDLVASVTLPCGVVLALLAQPITVVILGHRWIEVAAVLPPLAFAGIFRALRANAGVACKAVGRPADSFLMNGVGVVVTYTTIFPLLYYYGLPGAGLAVLAGMAATLPVAAVRVRRVLELEWRLLARTLQPSLLLAIAVALPVLGMNSLVDTMGVGMLILTLMLVAVAYLGAALLVWRIDEMGPLRLLHLMRKKWKPDSARPEAEADERVPQEVL